LKLGLLITVASQSAVFIATIVVSNRYEVRFWGLMSYELLRVLYLYDCVSTCMFCGRADGASRLRCHAVKISQSFLLVDIILCRVIVAVYRADQQASPHTIFIFNCGRLFICSQPPWSSINLLCRCCL
jgi:hypothetical protein